MHQSELGTSKGCVCVCGGGGGLQRGVGGDGWGRGGGEVVSLQKGGTT